MNRTTKLQDIKLGMSVDVRHSQHGDFRAKVLEDRPSYFLLEVRKPLTLKRDDKETRLLISEDNIIVVPKARAEMYQEYILN
jgi:hypothetical protein